MLSAITVNAPPPASGRPAYHYAVWTLCSCKVVICRKSHVFTSRPASHRWHAHKLSHRLRQGVLIPLETSSLYTTSLFSARPHGTKFSRLTVTRAVYLLCICAVTRAARRALCGFQGMAAIDRGCEYVHMVYTLVLLCDFCRMSVFPVYGLRLCAARLVPLTRWIVSHLQRTVKYFSSASTETLDPSRIQGFLLSLFSLT